MQKLLGTVVALGLGLVLSGCVRHVHYHGSPEAAYREGEPSAVVLEREHDDKTIVIVKERPGPRRHCWRHRLHWHCRPR